LGSLAGVAFAAVLMFLEMGFLNGMFDSQTNVVKQMNADLLLLGKQKESVTPRVPFPRRRLTQALSNKLIQAGYPVYVEDFGAAWKAGDQQSAILVFGINPDDPVFLIPEVQQNVAKLKVPDTALIDTRGKDLYGPRIAGTRGELALRTVKIVGTFPLGADFRVDGNMIVSDKTFLKCFANPLVGGDERKIEFGLLKVVPGADVRAVRDSLRATLADDVQVMTKQEFIDQVINYWATAQPVGAVFGMGMVVGFLIGVTICYQILFTDIMDHSPQYATLKAIGYSNGFLIQIVLWQAAYLAVIGFIPGMLFSLAAYAVLQSVSGILMVLTVERALFVLVLTVVMCLASGVIALQRVIRSDPSEVF